MSRNQYGFGWLQSNSTEPTKTKKYWLSVNIYGVGDEPIQENNVYCTRTSCLDIVWLAENYPLYAYDVYVTPINS